MMVPGMRVPNRTLRDIEGAEVVLGGEDRWTLLSFLRYASCPACLLYVRELVAKHGVLAGAGIDVAVVFHSPVARIRRHTAGMRVPFRVIADPERLLYRQFAVRASWPRLITSFLRPSFLPAYAKSLVFGYWGGAIDGELARMPADFVIGEGGEIVLVRYGEHIGDHVRIADVVALRARTRLPAGGAR